VRPLEKTLGKPFSGGGAEGPPFEPPALKFNQTPSRWRSALICWPLQVLAFRNTATTLPA